MPARSAGARRAGHGIPAAVSARLAVSSFQLPVASSQLPVASCQLPVTSFQPPARRLHQSGHTNLVASAFRRKMLRQVVSCWRLWYDHSFWAGGNNSVVECDLAKVEVAGSNPVSRSISHIGGAPCTPPGGLHYAPSSWFDFADHALSTVDGRCSLRSGRSCLDVVSAFAFQLTPRAPSPAE